jgi:hypothetical protein
MKHDRRVSPHLCTAADFEGGRQLTCGVAVQGLRGEVCMCGRGR